MEQDDGRAGGGVDEPGHVGTEESSQRAQRHRDEEHAGEGIGEQARADRRDHECRSEQRHSQDLQGGDYGGGQNQREDTLYGTDRNAVGTRHVLVERGEDELLPHEEECQHDDDQHGRRDGKVGVGDAEDLAEEGRLKVAVEAAAAADEENTDREGGGGDDADGGVAADLAASGDGVDEKDGDQPPDGGADVEVDARDEGDDRAAEDAVGQAVPDVGQVAQDHEHAHRGGERAHDRGGDHGADHEFELEGLKHA